ncbi:unnamed protein product [Rhizophagus irregularis]|uniref:Uncharacterized protein n=1 Tax=Rhizophagus irregularis TaxID=588596 RepID=A0A2I1H9U9_9GLOM|nr:hypothetical protein RhiirA4_475267 [Rhizophagus irregularis]CAB4439378.1 unnamed protein product [Rhizophagus irregularis]CAB4439463.1 unnamed protein product [Rhizophagus irregularis]
MDQNFSSQNESNFVNFTGYNNPQSSGNNHLQSTVIQAEHSSSNASYNDNNFQTPYVNNINNNYTTNCQQSNVQPTPQYVGQNPHPQESIRNISSLLNTFNITIDASQNRIQITITPISLNNSISLNN